MAAATKLGGDVVYIHVRAFRAKTDSGQFRLDFLEDTSNDDGRDGTDMVDETLGIAAFGAGARVVGFLQPKISDLVLMSEMEMAVDVPEQSRTGERIGLIDFIADFGEVSAAADEFAGNVISGRARAGILERAGIGRDGGEEAVGNGLGDGPFGDPHDAEDEFAAGRLAGRDPVDIGIAGIALVMIDVDEELATGDAGADFSEAVKAGGIRGNDAVELMAGLGPLKQMLGIEELVFLRERIFVPAKDFLAFSAEGESEP